MHEKPLVIYLSPYDILRPRTNQVSDIRFSEGFSQNNCEVHFITPDVYRKDNISKDDITKTYGLQSALQIHYLPTNFKDDVSGKWRFSIVSLLAFFKTLSILRKNKTERKVYIISRSAFLLQPFLLRKKIGFGKSKNLKIIYWAHDFKTRNIFVNTYKHADAVLATNSSIANDMCKLTGIPIENTFITLNPITEAQSGESIDKSTALLKTGLDKINKPLIVYTGKLAIDYNLELEYILKAAGILPNFQFVCTGGKPGTVNYWKEFCAKNKIENVIFTGYIPDYSRIKYYQYAADVLISYYTKQAHDLRYNLPNKLCEYMLTGNIIVTPDYPATKDLLNKNNCMFSAPESEKELAATIEHAVINKEESKLKAQRAKEDVKEITFKKRVASLMIFLENK